MASNPVVELWDVGGGSMITDSRHAFYDLPAACFCNNPVQRQYVSSFPQFIFVTLCVCTPSFTSRTKRIALQRMRGGSWCSRVSKAASYGTWRRRRALRMPTVISAAVASFLRFIDHISDSLSV
jgi:hypothetical protein